MSKQEENPNEESGEFVIEGDDCPAGSTPTRKAHHEPWMSQNFCRHCGKRLKKSAPED